MFYMQASEGTLLATDENQVPDFTEFLSDSTKLLTFILVLLIIQEGPRCIRPQANLVKHGPAGASGRTQDGMSPSSCHSFISGIERQF